MRRRRFWAKTLMLAAGLLAVVWVGSMRAGVFSQVGTKFTVSVSSGTIVLAYTEAKFLKARAQFQVWTTWRVQWWGSLVRETGKQAIWLRIPLWPFVLLTGIPGAWMLLRKPKPPNPNACPACGYDKTGLPRSPTGPAPCPECGKG